MMRGSASQSWRSIALLAALLLAACARPSGEPFRPVAARDSEAAFRELTRIRRDFSGARSYARVRAVSGEQRQSFNARISVDRAGRARIDALTPIGTAAITLWTNGQHVVYLDHLNEVFWKGGATELSGSLRVIAEQGGLLIAGLPADDPAVAYRTEPTGLAEASVGGVRFVYTPPQFPPAKVAIESGTDRLEIEHVEFSSGVEELKEPGVGDYRRGRVPTLVPPARG